MAGCCVNDAHIHTHTNSSDTRPTLVSRLSTLSDQLTKITQIIGYFIYIYKTCKASGVKVDTQNSRTQRIVCTELLNKVCGAK